MPDYRESFRALLSPHLPEAAFASCPVIDGVFPASVTEHDVYIFSGSPHGVYEELPWIRRAEDFVRAADAAGRVVIGGRSEEHTSELQSLMRNSSAVFCLKKKKKKTTTRIPRKN